MTDAAAPDAESSSGPGLMLRRAREAQGLSEQQAAEQLNLDVTVVSALERDDLAALGAPVFAKGHLRRYGAMLGLVDDEVLAAYERARGQPDMPTLVPRSRLEMMPVRGRPKWPWVIGGALLFVIAAGLAAYVSEYGFRLPSSAIELAVPTQDGDVTVVPALETPAATGSAMSAPEASAGTASAPDAAAALLPVPPGHVSLSLAFAADSWAEIYDGAGKAVLYDLGRVGTQRTIAAAAPLSVTVGNAPAVTLLVNGKPVTMPPAPAGQTVSRFTIEADGTLR